jgi:hypothetical protein
MAALSDFTCACAIFINAQAAERRAIILPWNVGRCKDGSRRWTWRQLTLVDTIRATLYFHTMSRNKMEDTRIPHNQRFLIQDPFVMCDNRYSEDVTHLWSYKNYRILNNKMVVARKISLASCVMAINNEPLDYGCGIRKGNRS